MWFVQPSRNACHIIDGRLTGIRLWRAGAGSPSRFVQIRLLAKDHRLYRDEDLDVVVVLRSRNVVNFVTLTYLK